MFAEFKDLLFIIGIAEPLFIRGDFLSMNTKYMMTMHVKSIVIDKIITPVLLFFPVFVATDGTTVTSSGVVSIWSDIYIM